MDKKPIHGNKKYLALFYDKCELLIEEQFTPAEIGEIVIAAIKYELYEEDTHFEDRYLRMAYKGIRTDIDISTAKADKRSISNRKNAAKRWDKSQNMTSEEMDAEINAMFPRKNQKK